MGAEAAAGVLAVALKPTFFQGVQQMGRATSGGLAVVEVLEAVEGLAGLAVAQAVAHSASFWCGQVRLLLCL
jgi:hypothetical protein